MDSPPENMEKTRMVLALLGRRVEAGGMEALCGFGRQNSPVTRPEAQRLSLLLLPGGLDATLRCGNRTCSGRGDRLAVFSEHFGVRIELREPLEGICATWDVAEWGEFAFLRHEPFLEMLPIRFVQWTRNAFMTAARRCMPPDRANSTRFDEIPDAPLAAPGSLGGSHRLAMRASLLEMMVTALSALEVAEGAVRPVASPFLMAAHDFMQSHHNDPDLTIGDVAGAVHLSEQQFRRRFREESGGCPGAYLRDLRLRQAAALLTDTVMPIGEIALAVGFRDPLHFSRVFSAREGKSPTRYRAARGHHEDASA